MRKLLFIVIFIATPSLAVEPLTSSRLLEQCSSTEEVSQQACRSWVHGFIGGAFASRMAKQTGAEKKESFSDRAARTRIGRGQAMYGQNYDAGYCVSEQATIGELVEKLRSHAAGLKNIPEYANQLMLGFLKEHYRCSSPSS